jgi:hypothetical protein
MIKTILAKYKGRCAVSGAQINPGDEVQFDTATRKTWLAEPGDFDIRPDNQGSYLIQIGNQGFIRNKRGRCIDAPCCGCCTI